MSKNQVCNVRLSCQRIEHSTTSGKPGKPYPVGTKTRTIRPLNIHTSRKHTHLISTLYRSSRWCVCVCVGCFFGWLLGHSFGRAEVLRIAKIAVAPKAKIAFAPVRGGIGRACRGSSWSSGTYTGPTRDLHGTYTGPTRDLETGVGGM